MMFIAGLLAAVAVFVVTLFLAKRLLIHAVARQFTGEPPPLLAWRILSVRQLDGLLRETMGDWLLFLSRSDIAKIQVQARKQHAAVIRNFEGMESIPVVSAFMAEHDLPFSDHDALASQNPVRLNFGGDRPAEYFPFAAPIGPIRMPAEFEPVRSVLLTWPSQYPSRWQAHADLVAKLSKAAEAHVVIQNSTWAAAALLQMRHSGAQLDKVKFIYAPSDDIWIRDYGPTLVSTGCGPAFIANPYVPNGLGFHKRDHDLPVEIARSYGIPVYRVPLVIEGGNLISDGSGRLFTSRSIFQHNVDFTEAEIRDILKAYYGAQDTTFLPEMPQELTGHIDFVLKLASPTAAWVTQSERRHPWYEWLERIADIMAKTHQVVRLPMAPARGETTEYCPANALTVNGTILFPSYDAVTDQLATRQFNELATGYNFDSVDYRPFTVGALHCQTKEIPLI
jgi:agmatine deiminase